MDGTDGDFAAPSDTAPAQPQSASPLSAQSLSASPPAMADEAPTAARYGDSHRVSLPTILIICLAHAALLAAAIQARHHYTQHREEKLTVVNLTPPPPPPAAEAPPPPSPTQPEVVSPPPIVQTPVPPKPQVMTTPDPAPVVMPIARVAPPAPPSAAPSLPTPPSTVQGGDLSAQMIAGKPPRYPIESRRKREQGTVVLSLVVGVDGRVATIAIAQSSGFARLDDAARDAVRGWRWSPIIRDGQLVMVKGIVEIPFVIQG
ncbi:MAG: energy transducer TonB [Sphingobium sp.]|nr:energy transducer TonB [Sphingobium sp.]